MRSFYGKKAQECEIATEVNQVEEEKPETADIVKYGSPLGGQNDGSLCVDGLPNEVSFELEVFNVHHIKR